MLDLISDVPYLPPHFVSMWKPNPGMPATVNADGECHPSAAESAETAPLGAASASGEEQSSASAAAPSDAAPPADENAPGAASGEGEKT